MEKRWLIKNPIDRTLVDAFRSELKVDPVVAELLLQRGISTYEEAKNFFRPSLEDLHDPFLMKDMEKAVIRLQHAIQINEKVLFFGDYDVDGTTAVSLMITYFSSILNDCDYYIPDRYDEGYGISKKGIDHAKEHGFSLIVSLDCGIKSVELIDYASSINIDFIVCDHHEPGDQLPNAIILDPKQKDCNYPYKELCGCGVGFKLIQGLIQKNHWKLDDLYELLDFVAIAIGADIVQITGENRILCHHGMRLLNEQPRLAFKMLLTYAKRSFPVSLTDVVFSIAPRINAAGRIYTGKTAVALMTSNEEQEIKSIADAINEFNSDRRELDQKITEEALNQLAEDKEFETKKTTIVCDESWHKGVVGIVASRLIEHYFKPTIVLTRSNGSYTGSARTVNDFDIHSALVQCEDLLEQFGGHVHAAGLTIHPSNLEQFKEKFEQVVASTITLEDLKPEEIIDLELDFNNIFLYHENRMMLPKMKRILNEFEPHGPGNMKPVFLSKNVYSKDVRILKEKHLKLIVTQPHSDVALEAIGFNLAAKEEDVALGIPFDMIYTLESNNWNGRTTLQLNIKDVRPSI